MSGHDLMLKVTDRHLFLLAEPPLTSICVGSILIANIAGIMVTITGLEIEQSYIQQAVQVHLARQPELGDLAEPSIYTVIFIKEKPDCGLYHCVQLFRTEI